MFFWVSEPTSRKIVSTAGVVARLLEYLRDVGNTLHVIGTVAGGHEHAGAADDADE